jgi:hypothetical protein
MTTPQENHVNPWYLRNVNQALALDEATGNVYIRTNTSIVGNVSIGNVAIGSLGNVNISGNTMPVSGNVTAFQGTDPWTVDGNVSITNPATDITIADSTYEMNVARGLVDNHSAVLRSAYLPDSTQNIETSIWVEGGIYPFATWSSAQKLYVISTSVSDTGQSIYIEGLDSNYDYQTETITTSGTSAVATTKNFLRIWTATITSSSSGAANAGEITFRLTSGAGTVVAHIGAGLGVTKLSQFTVPRNYSAYVLYGDCTTYHAGAGNVGTLLKMMVRPFGGSFVTAFIAEVAGGNPYRNDFAVPMKLTQKTDVDVRVTVDTSNTKATANWQIILIPN